MKIIKTMKDIEIMIEEQGLVQALLHHLQTYFLELHQSIEPDTDLNKFSLEDHGYLVILEAGDDVRNLHDVGLNPEDEGLLGTYPEWVDRRKLENETEIYQIGILYNNEYMMIFYSYLNTFDKEVEEWLKEQMQ